MQEQKKREAYRCLVIITDSHIREQLCEFLADSHIPVYYQMHGIGTASSEWLELCGLGSIQKSITLCFIPNGRKKILLAEMNQALSLHKKGTGIAVSIPMNGMQGFLYKLLNEHTAESDGEEVEKEVKKMSEPITHAMILVTINQGYSDAVMNTARAAGQGHPGHHPFGRPQRCPQAGRCRRPSGPQPQRSGNLLSDLFRHCVQLG